MNLEPARHTKEKTPPAPARSQAKSVTPAAKHTTQPVSPSDDRHVLTAKRAYELHSERGYRQGYALDDWLEAEREILNQNPGR